MFVWCISLFSGCETYICTVGTCCHLLLPIRTLCWWIRWFLLTCFDSKLDCLRLSPRKTLWKRKNTYRLLKPSFLDTLATFKHVQFILLFWNTVEFSSFFTENLLTCNYNDPLLRPSVVAGRNRRTRCRGGLEWGRRRQKQNSRNLGRVSLLPGSRRSSADLCWRLLPVPIGIYKYM